MKRREFIKTAAGFSLLSLLPRSGLFAAPAASAKRPNVLILFSDQHNANALGFAGNPNAHTPNLDRLAKQGTRFDRAYCNDGICAPSRNSLITGQYPRTIGIYDNNLFQASVLNRWTPMQRAFKRAGYYTFTTGKRHLLSKVDTDWDYSAGDLKSELRDNINYWTWLQMLRKAWRIGRQKKVAQKRPPISGAKSPSCRRRQPWKPSRRSRQFNF